MRALNFEAKYLNDISLDGRDIYDRELALFLAQITMNWGRLEYSLYLILVAIDAKRAEIWTKNYFSTDRWKEKKTVVRREVEKTITEYPEYYETLDDAFNQLDAICNKRNLLVHGLWNRGAPEIYEVQSLRFDKKTSQLTDPVRIRLEDVADLLKRIKVARETLALLGTEMFCHQWNKRHKKK